MYSISSLVVVSLALTATVTSQAVPPCGQTLPCNQASYTPCSQNCPTVGQPSQVILPTQPKCANGFVLRDGYCVKKIDLFCPAGSFMRDGRCIQEVTQEPICPLGSELRHGECVRIYDRVCPFGFSMIDGRCIQSKMVDFKCPNGSIYQNGECVRIQCPENYQLENGVCVAYKQIHTQSVGCNYTCQAGYYYYNGQCWPYSPPNVPVPQPVPTTCKPSEPIINTTPAPSTIVCAPNFHLEGNRCIQTVIECPEGTVLRGDKCESFGCPPSTSWNGQHCAHYTINGGNTTNLVNNTHLVNNYNNVTHDTKLNVQNINNVYIYKGGEVIRVTNGTKTTEPDSEVIVVESTASPTPNRCCTVVTPRLCRQYNSKWRCFNRKYQRCGSFCTQPIIQLKPLRPFYQDRTLVMPPQPPIVPNCGPSGCIGQTDCSGCQTGGNCSLDCYQYICNEGCEYTDQQAFCESNSGDGCGQQDGCFL